MILPKLLELPPLGGHSRRRSLRSNIESSLEVSLWRPRHSESAPRHQVRLSCTSLTETDPRRMRKGGTVFLSWPLAHMAVIFEPLSVVFVSSSHLPLSCFGSSGGHRTATRAEKSFFRPCIFGSSLRFLVGKASLRQLTEKRRTQSEPKFRRRRRGTRHPSRPRGARRARVRSPPGSVGPPARYGPPSPVRIFPVLPLPSFSCLHQNFPRRRWSVRPSPSARSFPAALPRAVRRRRTLACFQPVNVNLHRGRLLAPR